MTGPLHQVDDEFADFVRARQHRLLRAAYLVVGDEAEAVRLVRGSFTSLWLSWRTVRDEDLDAFVRRDLYRAATGRRAGRREPSPSGRRVDDEPANALVSALAGLTPRQRAVVVLLHLERRSERETAEVLGISTAVVAAQERSARARLHELAPAVVADPGRNPPATELGRLLEAASLHVEERHLTDEARADAAAHRRRRRHRGVAALAVVGALVAVVVTVPGGERGREAPTVERTSPVPTVGAAWDAGEVDVLGVPTQVGPTARQLTTLPSVSDETRNQLALPEVLAFGPDTRIPNLSDVGGSSAPVRAVLLRHTLDGMRAVLVRPTLANPLMLVDTVRLVPTLDEGGDTAEPLEVKAVADDRRHVMFVQPGRVLVLDAFTTQVRSFDVPDRFIGEGGWVGTELVVWSDTYRWRVSPGSGRVSRLGQAAYAGAHQVRVVGGDGVRILGFDAQGTGSASRTGPSVLSGVWGATFTNDDDRVATGGSLSEGAALELNRQRPRRLSQGVFTIDASSLGAARLLVAPESEGAAAGCCEVLGWAYRDEVLVRWRITDLLMWNARTGSLQRVATLPGRQQEPPVTGSAATSVAIAP